MSEWRLLTHFPRQVKGAIIIEDFDNMSVRDSMRMSAALPITLMMR